MQRVAPPPPRRTDEVPSLFPAVPQTALILLLALAFLGVAIACCRSRSTRVRHQHLEQREDLEWIYAGYWRSIGLKVSKLPERVAYRQQALLALLRAGLHPAGAPEPLPHGVTQLGAAGIHDGLDGGVGNSQVFGSHDATPCAPAHAPGKPAVELRRLVFEACAPLAAKINEAFAAQQEQNRREIYAALGICAPTPPASNFSAESFRTSGADTKPGHTHGGTLSQPDLRLLGGATDRIVRATGGPQS